MQRLPEIGEGVRVTWGLDTIPAEVVDVLPPDHALVAVPVEGASEESLETTPIRVNISALEELPPWRLVKSRAGRPAPGADAASAWWIEAARNGEQARVEVRVSGTLAATHGRVAPEAEQALQTDGRSAFAKFARRYRLPRVIVVGTNGVFEAANTQ